MMRKREAKHIKKYDSHRLGESHQGQLLGANANSPLLPGSARLPAGNNGNAQNGQRSATPGAMNSTVSPTMNPLTAGLSGLLTMPPAG